jgi:hypothetical protein
MKLIIDIPKELKQKIDEGFTNQVIINKLWDATRNGIPLEQISDEIKHLLNRPSLTHVVGHDKGFVDGIDKVLQIIDKYRG